MTPPVPDKLKVNRKRVTTGGHNSRKADMNSMDSYRNPKHTTPTVFHYTSATGLMGIIKRRELWATESNYLNDSSEVSFASNTLISLLNDRIVGGASGHQLALAQRAIALLKRAYSDPNTPDQYREDRAFITSFSRSDQSLTLWRAYGGQNGFCVGFDEQLLLELVGKECYPSAINGETGIEELERQEAIKANFHLEAHFQEISYGTAQVESVLEELFDVSADDVSGDDEARFRATFRKLSGIKHFAFADERETRLIVQEVGDFAPDPGVRVSAAGALVAYQKLVFPFDAVRSITVAPGANVAQTRRGLGSLLSTGGRGAWSNIEIRECEIPFVW